MFAKSKRQHNPKRQKDKEKLRLESVASCRFCYLNPNKKEKEVKNYENGSN